MKKVLPFIIVPILIMLGVVLYVSQQVKHKTTKSHTYSLHTEKPAPQEITLNEPTPIKFTIKNEREEVLKNFAIGHEKLMHVIVVRKDLTQYQHLHPTFNKKTGEFTVPVTFTVDGPYRLFADFIPADENPQKLSVTLKDDFAVGDISNFQPHLVTPDEKMEKVVPPDYTVAYMFPDKLKSNEPLSFTLTVTQNNEPITLENYLGALGHTVILKEGTLDYIHTHAGEHSSGHDEHSMTESTTINFSATLPEPGKYKMFTEFKHNGNVSIVDYTIDAK